MSNGFQSQALGFQRDGSPACKRIQQGREFSLVVFQNFLFSCAQHILIIGIFPDYQIFQNGKKPFPLFVLFFFRRE